MKTRPPVDQDLLAVIGPDAIIEAKRRLAMLDAIAYAATRMMAGDWRDHVQDFLKRLGHATQMSRVTMFEVHPGPDGHRVQSCRHDWADKGLSPLSSDPRYSNMPLSDDDDPEHLGEWAEKRERGEIVQAKFSETTGYTRQVFIEHHTLSFISVPIMVGRKWWGFLGFDDCKEERGWSSEEIHVLRTAAALIAGAVEREQADEKIRLSEERYALAARGAHDGLFDWDVKSGSIFLSPRLHEVLGLAPASLSGNIDELIRLFVKADGDFLRATFRHKFERREETFDIECRYEPKPDATQWIVMRGLIVYGAEGPRRVVGALRDITRQMEVQKRLSDAERKRANLARYFSPNMVDGLMQTGGRLDEARTQRVAVLFADIWGYTTISAAMPPMQVMALLRELLRMFEKAIFAHGGTLDKFLGDGLMATFGTPKAGPRDAANALACAAAMAEAIARWNAKRRANGLQPMHLGIGLHHGDVVLGDIGSERRMEFAVIGDTVNVASRIQEMTRALNIAVLASDAVIRAARQEAGEDAVREYGDSGEHELRGRTGKIRLWSRAAER
ncbi:GAF domain-containing protein [Nordella sp. HKS 07]|uniref:adenylate/guanylate cyclase domain-containing protein n=1 Tax=Nordella sp. HKS 07 TaxID=2712222 RepID=UPI0013E17DAD|nr:adenylate/guanylate cyclase domain-containing protein [Nordella sp. HKS 07]QIG51922.1 GAF domain-containing protein [Nordella sp. HKS 07]